MTNKIKGVSVDKISLLMGGAIPAVEQAEGKFSIVKMFTGIFKKDEKVVSESLLKFAEKVDDLIKKTGRDTTPDMFRYRVREPNLFEDKSFRTITLQKKPKIESVMGKLIGETTMTMQNLMFPTAERTLADAKKRVADHKDTIKKASILDFLAERL